MGRCAQNFVPNPSFGIKTGCPGCLHDLVSYSLDIYNRLTAKACSPRTITPEGKNGRFNGARCDGRVYAYSVTYYTATGWWNGGTERCFYCGDAFAIDTQFFISAKPHGVSIDSG